MRIKKGGFDEKLVRDSINKAFELLKEAETRVMLSSDPNAGYGLTQIASEYIYIAEVASRREPEQFLEEAVEAIRRRHEIGTANVKSH